MPERPPNEELLPRIEWGPESKALTDSLTDEQRRQFTVAFHEIHYSGYRSAISDVTDELERRGLFDLSKKFRGMLEVYYRVTLRLIREAKRRR